MEDDKARYRRFVDEAFNKGNLAVIDELIAADYVDRTPGFAGPHRDSFKQIVRVLRTAFPDLNTAVEELIQEGDLMVGRHRTTGTHQGEFIGMAPTGKRIDVVELHMVRIANGQAVEHWGLGDMMTMITQLGTAPEMAVPWR